MDLKNQFERLFLIAPDFKTALAETSQKGQARQKLLHLCTSFLELDNKAIVNTDGLDFALRASCINAIRQMLSYRSTQKTGFDFAEFLWNGAHKKHDNLPKNLSQAFFEDVKSIFSGAFGQAGIYKRKFKNKKLSGRQAGITRSSELDELCKKSKAWNYLSGMEPEIVAQRKASKERIINYFKCSKSDFDDYRWQLEHVIKDLSTLSDLIELSFDEKEAVELSEQTGIPFGITPYYLSLFDYRAGSIRNMAVRRQVIPPVEYVKTLSQHIKHKETQSLDFMLESDTSPIELITRRYPNIVILKPYNTCSQICVYCQRNWEIEDVNEPEAKIPTKKIDKAIDWISENPNITDVLVTGGDPLIMSDDQLYHVLNSLSKIDTVKRIRLGTRTPVVLPQRFTDNLLKVISQFHNYPKQQIALMTHFEHPYEVTPEAMEITKKVSKLGISVYNQTVFTIQNSRRFELCELRKSLRMIGIEPYYTFNAKSKKGMELYRVPIARLQQEAKEEARLLPGLLRTDEPVYNVPGLGKSYLRAEQNHSFLGILPDGQRVYEFQPWEKFINHAQSYIYKDLPIYDYLQKLAQLGENPEDYKSIYYYF